MTCNDAHNLLLAVKRPGGQINSLRRYRRHSKPLRTFKMLLANVYLFVKPLKIMKVSPDGLEGLLIALSEEANDDFWLSACESSHGGVSFNKSESAGVAYGNHKDKSVKKE